MDLLCEILPLPVDVICVIAAYDRVFSIHSIPKTDERYVLLQTIPPKYLAYYFSGLPNGWTIQFTNPNCKLLMCEPYKHSKHNVYTFVNYVYFDKRSSYFWE